VALYFGEMLANRMFQIYAQLGTMGQINNTDDQGNQQTYQVEGFQSEVMSAWAGSPTTATPIDDLRAAANALNRGTSSRFGQKSELLMADEGVTTLLATTQIRNAFHSNYGATYLAAFDNAMKSGDAKSQLNGDRSVNALFFGMGLPRIVPWNRGYYAKYADAFSPTTGQPTKANYVKFLSATQAVWLGYRPNQEQLGQLSFARHIGLESPQNAADYGIVNMKRPDSLSEFGKGVFFQVKYHNEMPHHYECSLGAHICPETWYADSWAGVSWD
jgi:hypothetical protein